jgi:succinate dehydrogenase / fumarate reductase cytochrome b subunit
MRLTDIIFKTSVGRKWIMALTGMGAVLFLVGHLGGNLFYFFGEGAYNGYAEILHSIPVLPLIQAGLAAMFFIHIVFSLILTIGNKQARKEPYYKDVGAGERNWSSFWMPASGILLLVYLLVHVWNMKMGQFSSQLTYAKVTSLLSSPVFAGIYIGGSFAVAWHLYHGAGSFMQSLGLRFSQYEKGIIYSGRGLAILLALGFASIPVYILMVNCSSCCAG